MLLKFSIEKQWDLLQ
uniref:Uncharacterized protein n=1 Tax=Rhizophora mucronata TaxID=61149 RepID=A0A2P2N7K0_RHIMU